MADSQVKTANICNITSSTLLNPNVGGSGTYISDNSISVYMSGTVTWSGTYCQYTNDLATVGEYYTISFIPICATNNTMQIEVAGTAKKITFTSGTRTSVTIQASSTSRYVAFYGGDTVEKTIIIKDIQIEKGETATPYRPYSAAGWLHSLRKLTTATETITSGDAIYADGTAATVGLKGNTVQNGTPTPDNPVQPQETGDRTANLFDKDSVMVGGIDGDGSIAPNDNMRVSDYIRVNPNTVYAATYLTIAYYGRTIAYYDTNKNLISTASNNVQSEDGTATYTITTPNNCYYVRIATYVRVTNHVDDIMFNLGAAPLPYQPYGYKIPISSASTTTPVYLGEVETTRKIKKLVLTGEEIILRDREREDSWRFFTDKLISAKDSTGICSHFEYIGTDAVNKSDNIGFSIFNNTQFGCRCPKSIANTATDFKSYLAQQYAAGTPVCVWYVLATETTGIVNEPLRKIGDYADTVSGITIPTITGADSFDVLTTLKPSEVELTYTGWHDASVKEWDGSDWQ